MSWWTALARGETPTFFKLHSFPSVLLEATAISPLLWNSISNLPFPTQFEPCSWWGIRATSQPSVIQSKNQSVDSSVAKYAFIRELTILALLRLPGHSPSHWKAHKSTNERYSQPGARRLEKSAKYSIEKTDKISNYLTITCWATSSFLSTQSIRFQSCNVIWSQGESQ